MFSCRRRSADHVSIHMRLRICRDNRILGEKIFGDRSMVVNRRFVSRRYSTSPESEKCTIRIRMAALMAAVTEM